MSWRQLAKLPIQREGPSPAPTSNFHDAKANPNDTKGPIISTAEFNPLDPTHVAELKKWCSHMLHKSKLSIKCYVSVETWQGYTLHHICRGLETIQTYRFSQVNLGVADLTFHSKPDWESMRSSILSAQQESDDAHECAMLTTKSVPPAKWISDYKTIIINSILTTIASGPPYRHIVFMELTADTIQDIITAVTQTCAATLTHIICRYIPNGIAFIITNNTLLQYTSVDAVKLYEDIMLFSTRSILTLADIYAIARQVLQHVCNAGIKFGTRDNRVMLDSTFTPMDVKYLMVVMRKKLRYHPANVFCQRITDGYVIIIIFTYGIPNAFDPFSLISTTKFDRGFKDDSPLRHMLHINAVFRPYD